MDRLKELFETAHAFLCIWKDWQEGKEKLLTPEFENSVTAMLQIFGVGDIPAAARDLAGAVAEIDSEWRTYVETVTQDAPMPRDKFWAAVEALNCACYDLETPPPPQVLETIQQLLNPPAGEKAPSLVQICRMYGDVDANGVWYGPFFWNGQPQPQLLLQEAKVPGSVIPPGWKAPSIARKEQHAEWVSQRAKLRASLMQADAQATSGKKPQIPQRPRQEFTPPPPRETLEDLVCQRVPVHQILKIFPHLSQAEVVKKYNEMQIQPPAVAHVPHPEIKRGAEEPAGPDDVSLEDTDWPMGEGDADRPSRRARRPVEQPEFADDEADSADIDDQIRAAGAQQMEQVGRHNVEELKRAFSVSRARIQRALATKQETPVIPEEAKA